MKNKEVQGAVGKLSKQVDDLQDLCWEVTGDTAKLTDAFHRIQRTLTQLRTLIPDLDSASQKNDTIKRKRVEFGLQGSESQRRAILKTIPDLMCYLSREGQILECKMLVDAQAHPLDLPPEMIIGKNLAEMTHLPPDLVQLTLHYIRQALTTGQMHVFEYQLPVDRGLQDFEARVVASGQNEVLVFVRNITQRKQVERALRESEANLRAILDTSSQVYILIARDYRVQAFNKMACWGLKLASGKKIRPGASIYDFIPDKDMARVEKIFRAVLEGEAVVLEEQHEIKGLKRWFEFSYQPVLADDGQVIGICLGILDIDDRKKMADALAEREARLLEEMQSVLVTTRALVSEVEVKKLLEFIMTQAKHLTGAKGAAILVLSEDGQWFEVATADKSWLQMKTGFRLLVQGSLAELAMATKKVQISNWASDDARTASIRALLDSVEVNAMLCAPLIARGESLGVLLVWNKGRQTFTAHDNHLMSLFADQAALAWRNTQLYSKNQELAIKQERHRLARELHDSVTQSLYSIGMAAQASLRLLPKGEQSPLQEPLEHIQQLSQIALTEIREQLYNLRPSVLLEKGMVEAIEQHCDLLSRKYDLSIKFETNLERTLAAAQQENLYYIAREALWNAIKYAQANQIRVELWVEMDQISLSIVDDGIGFEPTAIDQLESMGLTNMKERAKLMGGRFELQSEPERGARISVHTPMQPADDGES